MNLQLLFILFLIFWQTPWAAAGLDEYSHNSQWRYTLAPNKFHERSGSGNCAEILTAIKNLTIARSPNKDRPEITQSVQVTTDTLEEYGSEYRNFLAEMAIAKGNQLLMNRALRIAEKHWQDWIPPALVGVQGLVFSEEGVITGLKFWTSEELTLFLANGGAAAFERLHLTALDLNFMSDSSEIFKRLPEFKTLEALSLHQCNLGDSAYLALARLKSLRVLNISQNRVTHLGAELISRIQTLEHLGLNHIRLDPEKFRSFLKLQRLQSIDLQYGRMNEWLYQLGKVAPHHALRTLRKLDVARNDLDEADARTLAALFPNLEDLDLEVNRIGEIGIEALSGLKSLKRLNVQSNRILDAGARHLEGLQSLEWLDVSYNDLTNPGAFSISRIPELRFVDASHNAIGNEGVIALAAIPQLQDFNMRFNRLGRAGYKAIKSLREKISDNR